MLQPTSSFADAIAFHLGITITSSFSLCNPSLSSSSVWAMLGHSSHNDGIHSEFNMSSMLSSFMLYNIINMKDKIKKPSLECNVL